MASAGVPFSLLCLVSAVFGQMSSVTTVPSIVSLMSISNILDMMFQQVRKTASHVLFIFPIGHGDCKTLE